MFVSTRAKGIVAIKIRRWLVGVILYTLGNGELA